LDTLTLGTSRDGVIILTVWSRLVEEGFEPPTEFKIVLILGPDKLGNIDITLNIVLLESNLE
jgi:hypothetical protein